jgi:HEAT repeat protein
MPTDKDFKRIVRQRAAATGERYTVARAALGEELEQTPPALRPPDGAGPGSAARWVELLGDRRHALGAFALLQALPHDELVPALLAGLDAEDWRIRRSCCRLLDDVAFTDASLAGLQACLDDPHPQVRRAALHALACEHCKPDGCALDFRPLFERMVDDPSAKVREMVLNPLTWKFADDWAVGMLRHIADNDKSAHLRAHAEKGLVRIAEQVASDEARRVLPEELRRKTERHVGKWVAVAGGGIIGVARSAGGLRRIIKGTGHGGAAEVYWVRPD